MTMYAVKNERIWSFKLKWIDTYGFFCKIWIVWCYWSICTVYKPFFAADIIINTSYINNIFTLSICGESVPIGITRVFFISVAFIVIIIIIILTRNLGLRGFPLLSRIPHGVYSKTKLARCIMVCWEFLAISEEKYTDTTVLTNIFGTIVRHI